MAAIPGAARRPASPRAAEGPSLLAAWPIAGAVLALLITAQVLFPPQTFQATKPNLAATIDMTAASDTPPANSDELSPNAQAYTVNRVGDEESEGDANSEDELADATKTESTRSAATESKVESERTADDDAPKSDEQPALTREVSLLNGRLKFNIYDEAVLGSPDAKYVIVELMDYTCPHCRKMHEHVREAMDRYGDQLAVVIMPMPLELECNKQVPATDPIHRGSCKISKLALAVAATSRDKFNDFHNYLLADPEKAPTPAQAVSRAFRLVGAKNLREHTDRKLLDERIQKYIKLFTTLSAQHKGENNFGLPVQIVGDTLINGGDVTSEEMFAAWEKAIDIKPQ
jgi:hypothetical protein